MSNIQKENFLKELVETKNYKQCLYNYLESEIESLIDQEAFDQINTFNILIKSLEKEDKFSFYKKGYEKKLFDLISLHIDWTRDLPKKYTCLIRDYFYEKFSTNVFACYLNRDCGATTLRSREFLNEFVHQVLMGDFKHIWSVYREGSYPGGGDTYKYFIHSKWHTGEKLLCHCHYQFTYVYLPPKVDINNVSEAFKTVNNHYIVKHGAKKKISLIKSTNQEGKYIKLLSDKDKNIRRKSYKEFYIGDDLFVFQQSKEDISPYHEEIRNIYEL